MWLPELVEKDFNRRDFLKSATGIILSTALIPNIFANEEPKKIYDKKRSLKIERYGQIYDIEYEDEYGNVIKDGYSMLCRIFGDFHQNQAILMDIELFRILSRSQEWLKSKGYTKIPQLTSGYRTKYTNAHTEGAAQNSYHPKGQAGDVKFPEIKPSYVAQLTRACGAKGIGLYPTFTHFDTGKWRSWIG